MRVAARCRPVVVPGWGVVSGCLVAAAASLIGVVLHDPPPTTEVANAVHADREPTTRLRAGVQRDTGGSLSRRPQSRLSTRSTSGVRRQRRRISPPAEQFGTLVQFEGDQFKCVVDGEEVEPPVRVAAGWHNVTVGEKEPAHLRVHVPRSGAVVVRAPERLFRRSYERQTSWLARHQNTDGSWSAEEFTKLCPSGPCGSTVAGVDPAETTALALLCFVGAGVTHNGGTFKTNVRRSVDWLIERQADDGWLAADRTDIRTHAIATLAMTEIYDLTGSRRFKASAAKAFAALVAARDPGRAWRRTANDPDVDIETSTWCAFASRSAENAELVLPDDHIADVRSSLGEFGDPNDRSLRECIMLVAARAMLHEHPHESVVLRRSVARIVEGVCESRRPTDPQLLYFGSVAVFQAGGAAYEQWKREAIGPVVDAQYPFEAERVDDAGRYNLDSPPIRTLGAVRTTAYFDLSLEIYYRYGRVFGASSR